MRIQKETNLVDVYLFPFNYNIHLNRRYEFRAIICDNRLTGICYKGIPGSDKTLVF